MNTLPIEPEHSDYPGVYPRATLRDFYYTLLKHRWPVVAVALTTWLIGGAMKYIETPVYKSSALIQIDWGKINIVQDVMVNELRGLADIYGTQEQIVTSRLLAERVVDQERLWEHPLFAPEDLATADPARVTRDIAHAVQSMISVARVKKTQLMEINFVTPDPELSARLANAQVEQYIQFNVDAESGLARDTSSFIDDEVVELRREIMAKEAMLRDYTREKQIVMADDRDNNIVIQRLETLNLQLAQAEAELLRAEARYRSMRDAPPGSLEEVRNSVTIRELERKAAAMRDRRDELSSTFKDDWPEMVRLKKSLAEIEQNMDAQLAKEAEKVVASARVDYEEARDRARLLQRSLNDQKSAAQELQHASGDYEEIKSDLDNQRQMLQGLLRRRSETDLTADLGERQPVRVRFIERAEVPPYPFNPTARRGWMMVFAFGVVLGIGVAYLLDHWDDSIHTVEDLRRYIPLPYLGMIPRYGDEPALTQLGRKLSPGTRPQPHRVHEQQSLAKRGSYLPTFYDRRPDFEDSRNTLSERFRFLRGSMLLSTPESVPKIVLVTSPDKNCGKTFVSSNLGAALVQLNKKVLLIDSDLRNPHLHRVFRCRNQIGLTNVLTGQKDLHDGCIMRTDIANLHVLLAGPKSPNPGELLASPAMERTLQNAAEHFDFVILDSAPLLPVFDSHVLSTRCDGVVLVARSGVTSRHAAMTSIELIERVKGRITGVVLNDVNLDDAAQLYYHTHYTYEYGNYPADAESTYQPRQARG